MSYPLECKLYVDLYYLYMDGKTVIKAIAAILQIAAIILALLL